MLTCSLLPARNLRVAIVGDPQVDNETELNYARRSIYKELRERSDLDMVLILGDLVNDKTALFVPTIASLDSLPCPWYCVPGNHDRDFVKGQKRTLLAYRSALGYVDTSFVQSGTRFILMNDVQTRDRADYEAGFTMDQKHFLDSLLRITSPRQQIVLATHIPLSECKDSAVMDILTQHTRLLLTSAHTHTVRRSQLPLGDGSAVDELIAGSTCGTWWRGRKDADGIPLALQNCGAPRGYFIADFSAGDYKLQYVPVGRDKSQFALSVYDNNLIVNIFGGAVDAQVQLRIRVNGATRSNWYTLRPYDQPDPAVAEIIRFNSDPANREYRRSHKSEYMPMLRRSSPHVWYIPLSEILALDPSTEFTVDLRYTDPHYRIRERNIVPTVLRL